MVHQRWKVPISIVAVPVIHIEVIDHIDWLYNELNIYGGGFEPLISSCWFFLRNPNFFILNFDLPMCGNEQVVVFTPINVHFEQVSFFINVSDEEKFLLF